MADETEKSALERIADVLLAHHVEFIVIGGQAEVLHGSPRVTYGVDLCYRRSDENLRNLASALKELRPTLRGAQSELTFQVDAEALALGCNFTFRTPVGDLDLLGHLEPLGGYEAIEGRADKFQIGKTELKIIELDDLIAIKEHLGRPKDREALLQLLGIKRLRDEASR